MAALGCVLSLGWHYAGHIHPTLAQQRLDVIQALSARADDRNGPIETACRLEAT
ncbi:hypothetical protein [Roseovarius azorensis]|uniref:hypothetical protein n=1 Tax=Roseovarius azorensis TaxID=1287727 RepID=UPI001587C1D5|nr:hypothetical protein [Roseovarius azorensis]